MGTDVMLSVILALSSATGGELLEKPPGDSSPIVLTVQTAPLSDPVAVADRAPALVPVAYWTPAPATPISVQTGRPLPASVHATAGPLPSMHQQVPVVTNPQSNYYASPTVSPCTCAVPASVAPQLAAAPGVPALRTYRPLLAGPAQAVPANYTVGRGLYGQLRVYVPGQPLRNFLRFLSP